MLRNRAHKDKNHESIRLALEAVGCKVYDTAAFGQLIPGWPDMVAVQRDGTVLLVEVKSEKGAPEPTQVLFMIGLVSPAYRIFTDPEQATEAVLQSNGKML